MVYRLFLLSLFLIVAAPAYAAVAPTDSVVLVIGASPSYPSPHQLVTLRASTLVEKGIYTYTWTVNGSVAEEGVDDDVLTLLAGSAGVETDIDLTLTDASGDTVAETSYALRPASVDVLWEGDTYTPPFYLGKAYPNGDSSITLQVVPHLTENGKELAPGTLVYSWEADGKKYVALSGYGRSTASIPPTPFKNATTVTVTVSTRDGSSTAQGVAVIPIVSPKVVFYENQALSGTAWNSATEGTVPFTDDEMSFRAVPFFVNAAATTDYSWALNGSAFALGNGKPYVATFRKNGEGKGTSVVGVTVTSPGSIFQTGTASFTLNFQ